MNAKQQEMVKLTNIWGKSEAFVTEAKAVRARGKDASYLDEQDITFAFDSIHYTVPQGKSLRLPRYIADHAVKKAYSNAHQLHGLKIEELPVDQRNPTTVIDTAAKDTEIEQLKKQLSDKEKETEKLKAKLGK